MAIAQQTDERQAILQRCERFLFGHGVESPRQVLAALAHETAADERADRYGTEPVIEDFEAEIAGILGKEAALFLPTGTMAQQIALRIWSERSGNRSVGFHPTCHLEIHELKGYETLHGLHGRLIGDPAELIVMDDLAGVAESLAALLLELPQREIGGQLPSWEELQAQTGWARERGIAVHMDGARLWESGPFYNRPYAEICSLFDSVYVSFYKGLGAIAGAALAGPSDFIAEARIWARRHGGNVIHLFPYVVSARTQLRRRVPKFPAYHERARAVAAILGGIAGIAIKPDPPQTNMMHVYLRGDRERLLETATEIARQDRVALFHDLHVTEVPGYWVFELMIGDAAEALTDVEIRDYFGRIMAA